MDVKGELAAVTAAARRRAGQTVHVMDPMNVLKRGTARINPLDDLDPEDADYVERLKGIVNAIVIETGGRNRFFEEGAKALIAGAIDLAIRRRGNEFVPPEEQEEETVDE